MSNPPSVGTPDFLKKASSVASHYGFSPLELYVTKRSSKKTPGNEMPALSDAVIKDSFGNIASVVLEHCVNGNLAGSCKREPLLVYHIAPVRRLSGVRGTKRSLRFGLAVLGCSKSIGEALTIKTSLAILEDLGVRNVSVHINSLGDRDSAARFARELTAHLRRNIHDLPPLCLQALKRDPFEALEFIMENALPLKDMLPRPLHFLSEVSRRHLREVLEFLELDGIPYNIEDQLLGHRDCYSQTLFEIRQAGEDGTSRTLVRGGRCDELSKRIFRTSVPLVGAVFEHEQGPTLPTPSKSKQRQPKFFLVQLGFSAKLLSLSVLESLRKAHISVHQSINNDSLREQLEFARTRGAPYLIIMGQREVLDKTVIIRNVHSQAQEIVPLLHLSDHLKTSMRI